eukprot:1788507-Pyramimonas_sp.AAC.1
MAKGRCASPAVAAFGGAPHGATPVTEGHADMHSLPRAMVPSVELHMWTGHPHERRRNAAATATRPLPLGTSVELLARGCRHCTRIASESCAFGGAPTDATMLVRGVPAWPVH